MAYYHQEVYKNEHSVLNFIPKIRNSLWTALFMTPTPKSIKSDKMEMQSKSASQHKKKKYFFVNTKSIPIKEKNLSTKGHRHILKGQSKN